MPLARSKPRAKRRAAPAAEWWTDYFDETYLEEFDPIFHAQHDRAEVSRLLEVLSLPQGSRILDCPCGQGRHAHLLAEAGFDVDGFDFSAPLLARARARGTGATLRYTRGDMRRLPARWTGRFDAVLDLFTSFGFFTQPADDARVIAEFARVLRPGGVLIWHGGSRDGVMSRFLAKDWWTGRGGTLVGQTRSFDPLSGLLTIHSVLRRSGVAAPVERTHSIRLYTATRLAELFQDNGLIVERAYDGWSDRDLTRRSSEMLLVARKGSVAARPFRR